MNFRHVTKETERLQEETKAVYSNFLRRRLDGVYNTQDKRLGECYGFVELEKCLDIRWATEIFSSIDSDIGTIRVSDGRRAFNRTSQPHFL